jgi:hypothetical protein
VGFSPPILTRNGGDYLTNRHRAPRSADKGKSKESSSFLKKRTKKLLLLSVRAAWAGRVNQRAKVFCFFFSKKKYFLPRLRIKSAGTP